MLMLNFAIDHETRAQCYLVLLLHSPIRLIGGVGYVVSGRQWVGGLV